MSAGGANVIDLAEVAKADVPTLPAASNLSSNAVAEEKRVELFEDTSFEGSDISDEDLKLRRVRGRIPWQAFSITFIEFCERFSYYGTIVVCKFYLPHLRIPTRAN